MDYSETVLLPETAFPMRGDLAKREPALARTWTKLDLYRAMRKHRAGRPTFVLHDGPPYANGNIHLGHALNKILKDIIVKERTLRGFDAPYIPGWDCHGLPIEHKVVTELGAKRRALSQVELRKLCHDYAMKYVGIQRGEFERLGVLGDWDNPYLTLTPSYESVILDTLARLNRNGYVYRGLKPIHWCCSCTTALAEAEVEYEDHSSPSIFVKFPVADAGGLAIPDGTALAIWTTTPWTLPANLAVAVHPDQPYVVADSPQGRILLAEALLPSVGKALKSELAVIAKFTGRELTAIKATHPFIARTVPVLTADFVEMETGTGLVHIAPGHGEDDYRLGRANGLQPYSPVDHEGKFTMDFPEMAGVKVWDANEKIIALLREKGLLLHGETYQHQYPCCWRCKHPVIFRATAQWFVNVDHQDLRGRALAAIKATKWFPPYGEHRIAGMVAQRPDWCLSRQRAWGVPIPAVKCACGEIRLDSGVIDRLAARTKTEGVDVWFSEPVEQFLPPGYACGRCGKTGGFTRETDILDVWFDSGCSSRVVLVQDHRLPWPADLYLEGSDQHRGWFQLSLLPMLGAFGAAPYRAVLTHGFYVGPDGKKMSKSQGNAVSPQAITSKYGADILRLWVAASDYREDIRISDQIIQGLGQNYRLIRNTLRFCLGNLKGFDPKTHRVAYSAMAEIDRWALAQLHQTVARGAKAYDEYAFHQVVSAVAQFCARMSAFYMNLAKDRLYCDGADWASRRSAQTALHELLRGLTIVLAPILSHTAEEVWQEPFASSPAKLADESPSVLLADWPALPAEWAAPELAARYDLVLEAYPVVMKALEDQRAAKTIGASLEAAVTLAVKDAAELDRLQAVPDLAALFVVSRLALTGDTTGDWNAASEKVSVRVGRAPGVKCARCWRYDTDSAPDPDGAALCPRCRKALGA